MCVESVLHTDMVAHFALKKKLNSLYQMSSEIFDEADLEKPPGSRCASPSGRPTQRSSCSTS